MSNNRNHDNFFDSPRSCRSRERRCDSPRSRSRSPCNKPNWFPEECGKALERKVQDNQCNALERFERLENRLDCTDKALRCFRDEICRRVACLEKAACEQRNFDKRSLIEIDNLRCCIENMRARTLMAERGTACALDITQAEINRERFAQSRERIVRQENEAYLADRLASVEMAASAQVPAGTPAPAAASPRPVGYPGAGLMAPPLPGSPYRVERFGVPCAPGLVGEFAVGRGLALDCAYGVGPYGPGPCGLGVGPYGPGVCAPGFGPYGPGVCAPGAFPGVGPCGPWEGPCGAGPCGPGPYWNDCNRVGDCGKACSPRSCSPRRC